MLINVILDKSDKPINESELAEIIQKYIGSDQKVSLILAHRMLPLSTKKTSRKHSVSVTESLRSPENVRILDEARRYLGMTKTELSTVMGKSRNNFCMLLRDPKGISVDRLQTTLRLIGLDTNWKPESKQVQFVQSGLFEETVDLEKTKRVQPSRGIPGFYAKREEDKARCENLRKQRRSRGLTQVGMASVLGISESEYSKYETGAEVPSLSIMRKFNKFMREQALKK